MRVRGIGRLREGWAKLRGQMDPGPMVLLYHRVARLDQDPHLLTVSPQNFEEHLLALRKHYETVSLAELINGLAHRQRFGAVIALTFDDGYADNAETVLPLLLKHGIHATFYLASGFVGSSAEQLQDELERLLFLSPQCPDVLRLMVAEKTFVWALRSPDTKSPVHLPVVKWNIESNNDPTACHRAMREIHALLRILPPATRKEALDQLRSQCGDDGIARGTHRAMSWDQARELANCELVEIGAHTVNHAYLSALPIRDQRAEIIESKRTIQQKIGHPVISFAYPYGTRESYTPETVRLLIKSDFNNACSNFRQRIGRKMDTFQIPRFVVRNWGGEEFLSQIHKGRL